MKFDEAADDLLEYILVTRSPGTYRFYKGKLKVLKQHFKGMTLSEINKKHIIRMIAVEKKRNENLTARTLNKYVMVFKRLYKYTLEKDFHFEKLPETHKLIPIVTKDYQKKVFEYLTNRHDKEKEALRNLVLFKLILDTGLRISELLALKVKDIEFELNTIVAKVTKTKRDRYVFFTDHTKRVLLKLIGSHQLKDYIFINYENGKPFTVGNVQSMCVRLRETLKLKESISPHKWRHTFATEFIKSGGDLETLRQLLGHTTLNTTQKYLHIDKESMRKEYLRVKNFKTLR